MAQRILVVEDDLALAEALEVTLEVSGFLPVMANSAAEALEQLQQQPVNLVLSDVHMQGMDGHDLLRRVKELYPDIPMLLMTAYATVEKAVEAIREGAVDYMVKPFEADVLVTTVSRYALPEEQGKGTVVAEDPRTQELLRLAARVADSDATVMITGESGSGKEVIARYIHDHSSRADGPYVAINCAAIPENMLEATLFGYEKGAFTGAYKATPGKFEQAQGGTLLLDEISEMDMGLQAKLLRVLQERELERLGGGKVMELDVRVLATSNRDMRAEVTAGNFREDLYYRLNVFPLQLPPLRERPEDVVPLAESFIARIAAQRGEGIPRFSETAKQRLRQHAWPGNVRELDNLVQRAMILANGDEIDESALHFEVVSPSVAPTPQSAPVEPEPNLESNAGAGLGGDLKQREYQLIMQALASGNKKEAAEKLGISPRTLRYKIAKMREEGYAFDEEIGA